MGNEVKEFFDALAPNWDLHSEDKLPHIAALLSRLDIKPGQRVLDLGCGTGIISGPIRDMFGAEVLGLDVSEKMIEIAKEKYKGKEGVCFRVGDFLSDSLDETFDWVLCHNAYPHFIDVDLFRMRLGECLEEGGEFVVFHSLGRERLCRHHDGLGPCISRDLEPVEVEAERFQGDFQILEADESGDHFWIHGKK